MFQQFGRTQNLRIATILELIVNLYGTVDKISSLKCAYNYRNTSGRQTVPNRLVLQNQELNLHKSLIKFSVRKLGRPRSFTDSAA